AEDGIRDFHVTGVQTCALPIYEALRSEAEGKLTVILTGIQEQMEAAVPPEAKSYKMRVATRCPNCQQLDVKAAHYKSIGKKRLKAGEVEQPCAGFKSVKEKVVVHAEPFKLSPVSLKR